MKLSQCLPREDFYEIYFTIQSDNFLMVEYQINFIVVEQKIFTIDI